MEKKVIKKDQNRENFDPEKIKKSIKEAAKDASLPEDRIKQIVEKVLESVMVMVENRDEISTSEIKEMVLRELDKIETSVADKWREYNRRVKESLE